MEEGNFLKHNFWEVFKLTELFQTFPMIPYVFETLILNWNGR